MDFAWKNQFSWRIFISLGLFVAFFVLLVSGVILYISPPGRVANWTDWRLFGLGKSEWQQQHIIFGFAFAILSLLHLFIINWKAFVSYLKTKASEGFKHREELVDVILIALFFAFGTYFHTQPFEAIISFGHGISNSWERQGRRAPVAHAELMTLVELSQQPSQGDDPDALIAKLKQAGLIVVSKQQTLADIAAKNRMTAEKIYELIAPAEQPNRILTAQGLGEKSLQQIADEAGVSSTSLQLALRQKGVEAKTDMTLKTIAANNGRSMNDLRKIIEVMIRR
jgi:DNA-binding phage protein